MGDRGQVVVDGAVLYTHWGAADLPETVRRGIARGRHDVDYLTANIFREMVKGEIDSSLGYGIGTVPHGDAWRTVEITVSNGYGERVRVLDSGYDGGREDGEPPRVVIDLPIREYGERSPIRLEKCPMCRAWTDLDGDQAHRDEAGAAVGFRCARCGRDFLYSSDGRIYTRGGPMGEAEEVDPVTGTTINHETAAQERTASRDGGDGFWSDADVIHTYTRRQAITDGVLFDVSDLAREAGFRVPVAVSAAIMATVRDIEDGTGESETGRLWDVLSLCSLATRGAHGSDRCRFTVSIGGADVDLYATIGPGDDPKPVLTVMMIGED